MRLPAPAPGLCCGPLVGPRPGLRLGWPGNGAPPVLPARLPGRCGRGVAEGRGADAENSQSAKYNATWRTSTWDYLRQHGGDDLAEMTE